MISANSNFKILIIRRDNIGDLLCTTPAIHALRKAHPKCYIVVFANSYNAPIIDNNPDINRVEIYTKAKHRLKNESLLSVYINKLKKIFRLRKEQFDYVVVASSGEKVREWSIAKLIKPKSIIGYIDKNIKTKPNDIGLTFPSKKLHEVEYVFNLFRGIGVNLPIPPMQLLVNKTSNYPSIDVGITIGIHISSRRIKQRWLIENYANLIKEINGEFKANFLIFWSPGSLDDPKHPGDDEKALELLDLCVNDPVKLYKTNTLQDLVIGLSLCQYVICPDGGGMHIAAALQKPIICLFGDSSATHWYPWGVKHKLLQPPSKNVKDISVLDVKNAFNDIYGKKN